MDKPVILTNSRWAYLITPLLFVLLFVLSGCGGKQAKPSVTDPENTETQISYNHTMVYSGNGKKQYEMFAPEIRRYELAVEPRTVYPKGVKVETFNDSIAGVVDSDITANFAIYNEAKHLWEARGHVVANNYSGKKRLETELLFWDEATGKIYTDKRAVVYDNESVYVGKGFQTDISFETWQFNQAGGRMVLEAQDSTTTESSQLVAMPSSTPSPALTPTPTPSSVPTPVVEKKGKEDKRQEISM